MSNMKNKKANLSKKNGTCVTEKKNQLARVKYSNNVKPRRKISSFATPACAAIDTVGEISTTFLHNRVEEADIKQKLAIGIVDKVSMQSLGYTKEVCSLLEKFLSHTVSYDKKMQAFNEERDFHHKIAYLRIMNIIDSESPIDEQNIQIEKCINCYNRSVGSSVIMLNELEDAYVKNFAKSFLILVGVIALGAGCNSLCNSKAISSGINSSKGLMGKR